VSAPANRSGAVTRDARGATPSDDASITPLSPTRRRGRSLLIKLAAVVIGAVAPLLVLEAAVRTFAVDPGMFAWVSSGTCIDHSALLGDEFRPLCIGRLSETDFSTNSLGLRGPEVADDGAHRILAIGDSCTWGWRVSQDESYPAVLNHLLDGWETKRRYTVINAGVPGYTSYQGLLYFRERGILLHPEVVIIGFGFNDATLDGDVRDRIARQQRILPFIRLDEGLARHSTLYRWMRYQTYRPPVSDHIERVDVEEYERNVSALVQLVQEAHSQAVLVDFLSFISPYRAAEESVANRFGIPLVHYRGPHLDVVHPTAEGYQLFARALFGRLIQENYL
jgi:lysophospholipase L1-like esterase